MTRPAPTGCWSAKSRSGSASCPGVQGVEPLDHGAALAAVEVDGVAELAHAGVDGDEAEEDAQREQHDAEVHPAAGVVGVPDGVGAAAPVRRRRRCRSPKSVVAAVVVVVVRESVEGRSVVGRFVVRAATVAHVRQQSGARRGGGALAADDGVSTRLVEGRAAVGVGLRVVVDVDARDDLGGAGVPAGAGVAVAHAGAPYGLEQAVARRCRRGRTCRSRRRGRGGGRRRPRRARSARRPTAGIRAVSSAELKCRATRGDWRRCAPSCTRKLAWLTMTCAGSLGTLTMLSAGASSNPDGPSPVGVRGVLVSTLI